MKIHQLEQWPLELDQHFFPVYAGHTYSCNFTSESLDVALEENETCVTYWVLPYPDFDNEKWRQHW